ncbi:MAG: HIT domain-containing protein [Parachlamydia sp.]|nr:HIT domain-containing protein [Parachlamydia sp.]
MEFELHPNLASKIFIGDLPLCRVLLEDNQHYPWLFLVPRRPHIHRMMELPPQEQIQLMQELDIAQNILWNQFNPTQLNVAALGNRTPQLHVHVIARFTSDPAWPGAVWDHPARAPYPLQQKSDLVMMLQDSFNLSKDLISS